MGDQERYSRSLKHILGYKFNKKKEDEDDYNPDEDEGTYEI